MKELFLDQWLESQFFSRILTTIFTFSWNVLDNWIGLNPRYLGDPFPNFGNFGSINIGGVVLKHLEISAFLTAVIVIILLSIFFRKSKYSVVMSNIFDQEAYWYKE